ncbi:MULTISPECIES: response regulator [Pseudonocardia]|uniref:Transcriptional regulatory protein LiaR n=2 Tax=Pseudonocardia TaxID=1847 RepID=A0A1Y2N0D5_PSEAH|nr:MULTISPECIES: response regulator transcription factor [Pseudonocardia]OSY40761.1 Transcriptional regulatory protein LiaR [Pseudonocardia autotrophica]TDN71932.1 LuxR family two component transcriptional regulator [Pseudonocardia autotrophica]BBG02619.1 DNA-binding response regulator [Pseudonocardia autotrophica]GEC24678.1 DNA-binding response regulator [Pseudonocardia saturnea]
MTTPDQVPISTLLVDDHAVVRRGLRAFLDAVPGIAVVGDFGDGRAALEHLARQAAHRHPLPDVVLMDLMMPRLGGIDAIAAVRAAHPSVKVIALTSYNDTERARAALEVGASGYVLKDADSDEIATAIRAAARDEVHLDAKIARALARSMGAGRPVHDLTAREREVLVLVAAGKSNQDIATTLVISERTARTHVSHVIGKLGLESRVQAALWAIRNGLVTVD